MSVSAPAALLPAAALNAPLALLRDQLVPPSPLTQTEILPDLHLRLDPAADVALWHASPRARLLELEARVTRPGAWLGLHLTLPLPDLSGLRWFGFAARSSANAAMISRACLRSGREGGGFHDQFFDRDLLSHSWESDHHDLMALDHCPELPRHAPWREFILFLPPDLDFRLSLHDLRVFTL